MQTILFAGLTAALLSLFASYEVFGSTSHDVTPDLVLAGDTAALGATALVTSVNEVAAKAIVFGMSTALTGPAADLGINMRAGVEAAFAEANRKGGIRDRPVKLLALDDGYEPKLTAPNMEELLARPEILGVIGNVGTPTAIAALPVAIKADTLFFGAYTGAGALRKTPPDHCVINFRASYAEETGAMVDALIDQAGIRPEEIAFFTQRDGYGDAGFSGGIAALKRHGLQDETVIAHGRYQRNTEAVENALVDILLNSTPAKAVIMVGAYTPCAKFISLSAEMEFAPIFLNVSFVGARSLATALGEQGEGVVITQVVPHYNSKLLIAAEYRAAMSATLETDEEREAWVGSFGSLEGYIAARILLGALESWEGDLDRPGAISALEAMGDFDLGVGTALSLSKTEHQASHRIWPTRIRDGEVGSLDWADLFARTGL